MLGSTTFTTDGNGDASWSISGSFSGQSVATATATNLATGDTSEFSAAQVLATGSTTGALITELRFRGPGGEADEFVEVRNTTDAPLNLSGWQLLKGTDPALAARVPTGTIIPARGHYLFASANYSLSSYASRNQLLSSPLADGEAVSLRNAGGEEVDAVLGLSPTTGAQTAQNSFVRLSLSGQINDTNAPSDFLLVSTEGTSASTGSAQITVRGAPGPQNMASPVARDDAFLVERFDSSVEINQRPNQVRLGASTGPNAPQGTILFRRRITNTSNLTITRLRFRVQRLATQGSRSSTQADLRFLSSPSEMRPSVSQGGSVQVFGTQLEFPATEGTGPSGSGGVNSSGASKNADNTVTITLADPLEPGEARNFGFLFRVVAPGDFFFALSAEAGS